MRILKNSIQVINPEKLWSGSQRPWQRYLEVSLWTTGALLGFFHTWANRHYLTNADAMSYLDIAEAYLRGDWSKAVNSYWSPLYSWVIAGGLLLIKPSPYWKFSVLHLINFFIYIFTFGCFGFFIRELIRFHRNRTGEELGQSKFVTFPDWGWLGLGYSIFIWSTLYLIKVSLESPDLLLAGFVYLSSGILLLIHRRKESWFPFVFLGTSLGLGYLTKTVMLPLSLAFLAAAALSVQGIRKSLPRITLTLGTMLLVISPFVSAISLAKGRLTLGDSGRLNYLWAIEGIPPRHWQGQDDSNGRPRHRTQKLLDVPPVYKFADNVGGTYPLAYDPSYWYEGAVSHFDLKRQLKVLIQSLQPLYDLYLEWGVQNSLMVCYVFLIIMRRRRSGIFKDLWSVFPIALPALGGLGIYSLINVQGRYLAPFIVLGWLALFSGLRLSQSKEAQRVLASVAIALIATIMSSVVISSFGEVRAAAKDLIAGEDVTTHDQWLVAEGLKQMGVENGAPVAVIGDSYRAFWAHLAGLQIIAEIPGEHSMGFWALDGPAQKRAIQAFAQTGAKVIVADPQPQAFFDPVVWQKIGNTGYHASVLR